MRKRNPEEAAILRTTLLEVDLLKAKLQEAAIWETFVKESYRILCADGLDDAGHVEAFRKIFEDVAANDLSPKAALKELSAPAVLSSRLKKAYGIIQDEAALAKGQDYLALRAEITLLQTGTIEARKENRRLQCKNLLLQRKNKKLLKDLKLAGVEAKKRNYRLAFVGVAASLTISLTVGALWHYNIIDKAFGHVDEAFSSWKKSIQVEKAVAPALSDHVLHSGQKITIGNIKDSMDAGASAPFRREIESQNKPDELNR